MNSPPFDDPAFVRAVTLGRAAPFGDAAPLAHAAPLAQVALVALLAVIGLLTPGGSKAEVPLADSAHGMSCDFVAAAGRIRWDEPGGDWVDRDGKPYGERAYAVQRVPRTGRQVVRFDLTSLAWQWHPGAPDRGAVFLRAVGPRADAVVHFVSREHPDEGARPRLELRWDDGSVERLVPEADAHFSCSTNKGLGRSRVLRVGGGSNALLAFAFEQPKGRQLASAELVLTSSKQYAHGTSVGVFRPDPPVRERAAQPGIAAAYPMDRGIESDPAVLFADGFEGAERQAGWSKPDSQSHTERVGVADDAGPRFEPFDGQALKVTVQADEHQGLNTHLRFARLPGGEPEEVYFRYYLRFGEDWDPKVSGGKMPGLSGTYGRGGWGGRKADGTNGWSARGSFFEYHPGEPAFEALRGIGTYLYQADNEGPYGATLGWTLGPTGLLEKNRWYSVEQYVKMNTPGESDGILRGWIDGKLAFEKTNIRYRDVPELKIESVWMNVYHGGTKPSPVDMSLYIDNVVVARRYIGPVGTHRR